MSQEGDSKQGDAFGLPVGMFKVVFENLKGHPKETLAGVAFFAVTALFYKGVNPWFAGGTPCAIYLLYIFKDYMDNSHKERMMELQARETEKTLGTRARSKAQRSLQKRRRGNDKS